MTFEQFRATKTACDDLCTALDTDIGAEGIANTGFIYCGGWYIQNQPSTPDGKPYYLVIYNEDWIEYDLDVLERRLYENARDEGALAFATMSRDDLAHWYESNVGYDPVKDDPTITTEQLRSDVIEYARVVIETEAEDRAQDLRLRDAVLAECKRGRTFTTVGDLLDALAPLARDIPITVAPDDSGVVIEVLSGRLSIAGEVAIDEGNVNRRDCL